MIGRPKPKRSILDDLVDEEPELHHYTTFDGLKGIIQSNSLWGTHFRHTNDSTEFTLLHALLVQKVGEATAQLFRETYKANQSFRSLVHDTSGTFEAFIQDHADGAVTSLYDFDIGDPVDGNFLNPEDGAFLTCFCAHNHDDAFIRQNGLLSQWRGYTGSTKFCIVFDTKGLVRLARMEAALDQFRFATFDRVRYADQELPVEDDFQALALFFVRVIVEQVVRDKAGMQPFEETSAGKVIARLGPIGTFLSCATKIKHKSFSEEREIRLVAFRIGPATLEKSKLFNEPLRPAAPKVLRSRERNGVSIPYIAFFEELGNPLPIKRIIVGPSRKQQEQHLMIREFVPLSIPIINSSIPFLA